MEETRSRAVEPCCEKAGQGATSDERLLDILGIFHYVWGILIVLFTSVFLVYLVFGIVFMHTSGGDPGAGPPPKILGLALAVPGALGVTLGWTLAGFVIAAGKRLRDRRKHVFCMVMAGIECLILPLGTILGVITLTTLMRDEIRALFA